MSLSIGLGEIIEFIIGPNGAGKTYKLDLDY